MSGGVEAELERHLGLGASAVRPLHGGSVAEVYSATLEDGRDVVVKLDRSAKPTLDVEGFMLDYLRERSNLPVPEVFHAAPGLLVMELLAGDSRFSAAAERHAAKLLAELHGISADRFGLERDTLIGSLHQPNDDESSWIAFFREHRLLHMAEQAQRQGRFDTGFLKRIEGFAARLDDLLEEPEAPALLHGDVWTTNVLADNQQITGFIDPAVYFGHPEIELAFITLFSTFGSAFFDRYDELRGIRPGFFEERRDIYNLYPLLVHVRLFGGGYVSSVDGILKKFGA